ncbi:LysR family transcriptional regulator [Uliginosibacterium sp. H1]|uniref:LysR family transcriptional regulator n=1 Tax=Uliginosibacterium sp. H1 TaxID=3114757 RepID=UPI002E191FF6|nr:LysR family transcriptional regulator [Uliginosibacterium sp. H1]
MADRRLQVFHAVARLGSFTRAAETLFMTQPAVTFQIKQLEEQFNTRLLDRGHGKVTLTPAGEIVFNYADRILGLSDEMETRINELANELSGTITIGVSRTIAAYWLPTLLEKFKEKYPRVVPRVFVGNSELMQNRVVEHELDVGIIEREVNHPSLECTLACRDELLAIVRPDHELAGAKSLTAEQLQAHPFVDHDPGAAFRALAEGFFRGGGVSPDSLNRVAELGSLAVIKQFVRLGSGFAIASSASLARERKDGSLAIIPLEPRLYSGLTVLVPSDRFRARLHSTFAEFAVAHLAQTAQRMAESAGAAGSATDNPHP